MSEWVTYMLSVLLVLLVFIGLVWAVIGGYRQGGHSSNEETDSLSHDGQTPAGDMHSPPHGERDAGCLKVTLGYAQHIGMRNEQQDVYDFLPAKDVEMAVRRDVIAVLADGMGGFELGREAAQLAVHTMLRAYMDKSQNETVAESLERSLRLANEEVKGLAQQRGLEWRVGTTLVAVVISENELYWISVGDSRIYLYNDGELTPLTNDHIYANRLQELVNEGELAQEEADSHTERWLLTSYLGVPELIEVDANRTPFQLQAGDWILLCSDGIYPDLTEQLLQEAAKLPPQEAAAYIVQQVLAGEQPYQDNASIVILACS
ncbi:PP2C-family Ser/Thr phosphatase [compost metagenome]